MYPAGDQLHRDRRAWLDSKYPIGLVGADDLVGRSPPVEAPGRAEALRLCQKSFAAPDCIVALRPLDGDAGDVCELCDQILLDLSGTTWISLINREGAEYFAGSRHNGCGPDGSQPERQRVGLIWRAQPPWVALNVKGDHLCLVDSSGATWRGARHNGHTPKRPGIGVAEAWRKPLVELLLGGIDQEDGALALGRRLLDKRA